MKKYNISVILLLIAMVALISCEKKVDPIDDTFTVQVNFKNSGPGFLTSNVEVNPKDSIFFDFNLTSEKDVSWIEIKKNDTRIDTFKMTPATSRNFSKTVRYRADSSAGSYSYRILAYNSMGVYLGDGGKLIVVTVKPDFDFYSYRFLYVPDSTAKTNKCYFATKTGQTFSYTEGAANSALIDFGYYYDTAVANKHTIYALSSPQPQLSFYDISTWTKNATIFKRATTPTFANLTAGAGLRAAGLTNLASGTASKITAIASGNLIFFKTAAGKYGAIDIRFIEGASANKTTYINVDVKIEK
jgi:hypothetical protein